MKTWGYRVGLSPLTHTEGVTDDLLRRVVLDLSSLSIVGSSLRLVTFRSLTFLVV